MAKRFDEKDRVTLPCGAFGNAVRSFHENLVGSNVHAGSLLWQRRRLDFGERADKESLCFAHSR